MGCKSTPVTIKWVNNATVSGMYLHIFNDFFPFATAALGLQDGIVSLGRLDACSLELPKITFHNKLL